LQKPAITITNPAGEFGTISVTDNPLAENSVIISATVKNTGETAWNKASQISLNGWDRTNWYGAYMSPYIQTEPGEEYTFTLVQPKTADGNYLLIMQASNIPPDVNGQTYVNFVETTYHAISGVLDDLF
jgi:hypothetical protein